MLEGILIVVTCIIAYLIGWINAHKTIAKECKNLGKFYVDKEIFTCVKIEDTKEEKKDE